MFIFGDKVVKEIEKSNVADKYKSEVMNAKKYAEGRGLVIDVKEGKCITDIKKLIKIKINN